MADYTRDKRQTREIAADLKTRSEESGEPVIEGYFAVFNDIYEMFPGATETIAPGSFTKTISDDIRALINHDTTLVLGRTAAHTLELSQDERGLFGRIRINPNDTDAMNLYARVKRGDVSQCSIGFEITEEDTEYRDDGSVHWTIKEVKLYEVSCCTFPAYENTGISARKRDLEALQAKRREAWKAQMLTRLKGGNTNAESTNA